MKPRKAIEVRTSCVRFSREPWQLKEQGRAKRSQSLAPGSCHRGHSPASLMGVRRAQSLEGSRVPHTLSQSTFCLYTHSSASETPKFWPGSPPHPHLPRNQESPRPAGSATEAAGGRGGGGLQAWGSCLCVCPLLLCLKGQRWGQFVKSQLVLQLPRECVSDHSNYFILKLARPQGRDRVRADPS